MDLPLALISVTPDPVAIRLGPIAIPWYGLGYAAALTVGVWLAQREATRRGLEAARVTDALLLVVVLGVIGARLYHVIDEWERYRSDLLAIVLPPYSGLALYGGVAGGIAGVAIYARRNGLPAFRAMDLVVPSLFFGQAIARWGNFFNQELYGPPTDLPWGIAIDCAHRVAGYLCPPPGSVPLETGFHPLFAYESLLTAAGGFVALWLSRGHLATLRDGDLLALWLAWYGAARIVLEGFRSAYNWTIDGVPVATLLGAGAIVAAAVLLLTRNGRSVQTAWLEADADESETDLDADADTDESEADLDEDADADESETGSDRSGVEAGERPAPTV